MRPLFFEGKKKALTFSFDDNTTQDYRLVELFNKYGMKCTFNVNSGKCGVKDMCSGQWKVMPVTHHKIEFDEIKDLYEEHEVAVHAYTHPWLNYLDEDTIRDEIMLDRINLEKAVGYPVCGMAYPYGTYNELVLKVLKECGIKYSRTVCGTKAFGYPQNFLEWHPTIHFGDEGMDDLKKQFKGLGVSEGADRRLPIFYVWGHSFELDGNDTWGLMEEFCADLAGDDDTWFATNMELVEYKEALDSLVFSADGKMVKNNSAISVWMEVDGVEIEIEPGETIGA